MIKYELPGRDRISNAALWFCPLRRPSWYIFAAPRIPVRDADGWIVGALHSPSSAFKIVMAACGFRRTVALLSRDVLMPCEASHASRSAS